MNVPIGARREYPRLGGVEHHAQGPQRLCNRVSPQHLHRYDERIAHQIRINHAVKDVDTAIV